MDEVQEFRRRHKVPMTAEQAHERRTVYQPMLAEAYRLRGDINTAIAVEACAVRCMRADAYGREEHFVRRDGSLRGAHRALRQCHARGCGYCGGADSFEGRKALEKVLQEDEDGPQRVRHLIFTLPPEFYSDDTLRGRIEQFAETWQAFRRRACWKRFFGYDCGGGAYLAIEPTLLNGWRNIHGHLCCTVFDGSALGDMKGAWPGRILGPSRLETPVGMSRYMHKTLTPWKDCPPPLLGATLQDLIDVVDLSIGSGDVDQKVGFQYIRPYKAWRGLIERPEPKLSATPGKRAARKPRVSVAVTVAVGLERKERQLTHRQPVVLDYRGYPLRGKTQLVVVGNDVLAAEVEKYKPRLEKRSALRAIAVKYGWVPGASKESIAAARAACANWDE